MYVIGWSGTIGKWRIYEIRFKNLKNPSGMMFNRAFFQALALSG